VILSLFSVGLPLLIAVAVPAFTGSLLSEDPEFLRLVHRGGIPIDLPSLTNEGAVQAFVFQQFLMLQLLIPATGAMAFAGYSLIGEKQGRTLEPLLATPITTPELLIGKSLGALLPSFGIMIAATLYIMKDISIIEAKTISFINLGIILGTFLLLQYTKIPSPVIVLACLILGYFL
jgi:ABC-type Na+ efflux pump permease subunit